MKLYAPSYYPAFSCLADRCRHTCCAGWEIDIDAEALARYQAMEAPIGSRLRANMEITEDGAVFRLTENGRCPMLNANGLCDLIAECGEDALCQICADHPRFRNFFSDRTEIGLGLCCEAAAKLILSRPEPVSLLLLDDDGKADAPNMEERALLSLRERLIAIAQQRDLPLCERMKKLEKECGFSPLSCIPEALGAFLLTLERLDPAWTACLQALKHTASWPSLPRVWDVPFEQLLVYLLYRHLPGALEDGLLQQRIAMCLLLCRTSAALFALQNDRSADALADIVRMLSSEIEYSDENIACFLAFPARIW